MSDIEPPSGEGEPGHRTEASAIEFIERFAAELSSSEFELPVFPDIALQIRDALNDPEVSIEKLSRIIRSDPSLTAHILRLANSALLKRGTKEVTELKSAIRRIGFKIVRNAAVVRAMDSLFSAPKDSLIRGHIKNLREHSIRVASISFLLARQQSHVRNPDEAMLAGLLHDIGKFYILTRIEKYPDLLRDRQEMNELLKAWHTGVGRAIVESWGFTERIAEAVDEHEELDRTHFRPADITDIVIAANLIANNQELPVSKWPDLGRIPCFQKLQIDEQAIQQLVRESLEEIDSLTQAFSE